MRYAWVLTNVDGIVCAFDTEPTDDEVLDAVNHYYGDTRSEEHTSELQSH
mgnify:CR=1 FL=1